jgi:hypothetical protein
MKFTDSKYRVSFYNEKFVRTLMKRTRTPFSETNLTHSRIPPNSVGASGSYWLLAAFN